MRNLLVLGAFAAATAAPAFAQEVTISGNVALTTDYMWRNVSQTGMDWAIQGGFDLETESGFYAGTWASSLADAGPSIELDFYAGYGFSAGGVDFDIGYIYYAYPDEDVADLDFYEIYAGVSKEFGSFGLGGMLSYDPDNETTYLDVSGSYALNDSLSIGGGYGKYLEGVGEYEGWNFGGSWSVGGVDLGVTYYDNDGAGDNDNVLFSIGKSL